MSVVAQTWGGQDVKVTPDAEGYVVQFGSFPDVILPFEAADKVIVALGGTPRKATGLTLRDPEPATLTVNSPVVLSEATTAALVEDFKAAVRQAFA